MSLVPTGFGSSGGSYTIDDSLRFRSSASAYLSRTQVGSVTDNKKYTISFWYKRGTLGTASQTMIQGMNQLAAAGQIYCWLGFNLNTVFFQDYNGSSNAVLQTTAVYRDPAAWYHVVAHFDSAQATASNRMKLYVNGEQITTLTTANYPTLNATSVLNFNDYLQRIGNFYQGATYYSFDGYLTEVNFIDGQALDAEDFGEFDDNGTWKPIAYEGTYGTNGFYLDGTGVTDESGNGNDWTNNNLNLATSTATTYDLMKDTPTLVGADAGNFATLNPLNDPRTYVTYSDGNLTAINSTSALHSPFIATIGMATDSGKYYWEVTGVGDANTRNAIGIGTAASMNTTTVWGFVAGQAGFYIGGGASIYFENEGTTNVFTKSWTTGDVIMYAYDASTGKFWAGQNNVWYNSAGGTTGDPATGANPTLTLDNADTWFPGGTVFRQGVGSYLYHNFGQRPFAYTPPSGFLKLNTFNLPDSTIEKGSDYFNTVTYTGTGVVDRAVTGVGFQPDFTWFKSRGTTNAHNLTDAVRGAGFNLISNSTSAEIDESAYITGFIPDGIQLGALGGNTNLSSVAYAAWNWKANGSGALNEVGDIDSTVSVNTTAGFSIVSYTGTGSATTVGHGLGVAPSMMIVKGRESAGSWAVYHSNANASPASGRLYLQLTNAFTAQATAWNSTVPSSTVFSVGSLTDTNESTKGMIAYCFAPVEGYSAFGKYTGNGSADGPFVYTGFRPAYVMVKRYDTTNNWLVHDSKRDPYNQSVRVLFPNLNNVETVGVAANYGFDLVSNGIKVKGTTGGGNDSGGSYIYMAFAENPFKNANAR